MEIVHPNLNQISLHSKERKQLSGLSTISTRCMSLWFGLGFSCEGIMVVGYSKVTRFVVVMMVDVTGIMLIMFD